MLETDTIQTIVPPIVGNEHVLSVLPKDVKTEDLAILEGEADPADTASVTKKWIKMVFALMRVAGTETFPDSLEAYVQPMELFDNGLVDPNDPEIIPKSEVKQWFATPVNQDSETVRAFVFRFSATLSGKSYVVLLRRKDGNDIYVAYMPDGMPVRPVRLSF